MHKVLTAVTASALLALASTANAGSLTTPPGVYFGTGNGNVDWTIEDSSGVELGLDTLIRFVSEVTPTGNVYDVGLGNTTVGGKSGSLWGFAFSVFDSANPLDVLSLSLSITDVLHGNTVTFDPSTIPDNAGTDGTNSVGGTNGCFLNSSAACTLGTQKGIQNAEALSFPGLDPNYNSSENNTWLITLTASIDGAVVGQVSEVVNAGSGAAVPEPASMALLGAGLVGLGAIRRRRRAG